MEMFGGSLLAAVETFFGALNHRVSLPLPDIDF